MDIVAIQIWFLFIDAPFAQLKTAFVVMMTVIDTTNFYENATFDRV